MASQKTGLGLGPVETDSPGWVAVGRGALQTERGSAPSAKEGRKGAQFCESRVCKRPMRGLPGGPVVKTWPIHRTDVVPSLGWELGSRMQKKEKKGGRGQMSIIPFI